LTTGSVPGFVDVVLNFGSSALGEDSLIGQWSAAGRDMNLFGDDTWIKLFPNAFTRMDGTTSFFVSDYTEVRYK
jgi:ethanolaminephosphotransferase